MKRVKVEMNIEDGMGIGKRGCFWGGGIGNGSGRLKGGGNEMDELVASKCQLKVKKKRRRR